MPPQLCSNCRVAFAGNAPRIEESGNISPEYYIHRNYQSFLQSRQSKCRVCYDLWNRLGTEAALVVEDLSKSGLVVSVKVTYFPDDEGKPRYIFWMVGFYANESSSSLAILRNKYVTEKLPNPRHLLLKNESYQFIYSRIFILTESLVSEDSRSLDGIGSSTSSQPSRDLIDTWVRSCVNSHPECKPWRDLRHDPVSPARILDVGKQGDRRIYLRILDKDNTFDEDYITISYCRGNSRHRELNKGTVDGLISGFEAVKLSKTFRNAVALTRQVGVRYLWIDSLCVFQDSEDDRRIEGEKADEIYGNGIFNICAIDADNCNGGLFFDRDPVLVQPLQIRMPWPVYERNVPISYDMYSDSPAPKLYNCSGMGDLKQIMGSGPVNDRAWSLQERLLSRRTLYCSKEQLYWECKRGLGNESFPNGVLTAPEAGFTSAAVKILDRIANEGSWKISKNCKEFQPPSDKALVESAYREWLKLIEIYTASSLTRHRDILVAFLGIARRFEVLLGDEYLSGLLVGDIYVNILWFTKDPSVSRQSVEEAGVGWKAPTWSWAAVKGKVEWNHTYPADPRFSGELLEGNLLEYIGNGNISLVETPDDRSEESRIGLRVKAFWTTLYGYFLRPPTATALKDTGIHSRVLWMRTSFENIHYGIGQFDSPEIIQQVAMKNGGLEIGSVIAVPVRWIVVDSFVSGLRERVLKVMGLMVRPVKGDGGNFEVFHRIGRFTLHAPQPVGAIVAEDALMIRMNQGRASSQCKERVLV